MNRQDGSAGSAASTHPPKCARCSHEILDGDLVTYRHGDWFHMRCWRVLVTGEQIRESRRLTAQSRQRLIDGKGRVDQARETLEHMLCVVCQKVITAGTNWMRSGDGPRHTSCGTSHTNQ